MPDIHRRSGRPVVLAPVPLEVHICENGHVHGFSAEAVIEAFIECEGCRCWTPAESNFCSHCGLRIPVVMV